MTAVIALLTLEGALLAASLVILVWQVWRQMGFEKSLGSRRVIMFRFGKRKIVLRSRLTVWRIVGQKRVTKTKKGRHIPWIHVVSAGHSSKTRSSKRHVR